MGNKTSVLVVTHKQFDDSILPPGYNVVAVGDLSHTTEQYQSDADGANISSKNPYYCELTAQYWAWKNLSVDICGLVHYRRYFLDYQKGSTKFAQDIVSEQRIGEILSTHKVILPFDSVKVPGTGIYYSNIPEENNEYYWRVLKQVIEREYPSYMQTFYRFMRRKKYCSCNMFISTKEVFDAYSEWLFTVLEGYDSILEASGVERIPRVDGYLSECLLNIFFQHNFKKHEIYRLDAVNVELSSYKYPEPVRSKRTLVKAYNSIRAIAWCLINSPKYIQHKRTLRREGYPATYPTP